MQNKVLIADDDRIERRLITRVLKSRFDFDFLESQNGQQVLETLRANENVKVIIMDLNMPIMDGQKALELLKKDYPNIPVIILTGTQNMNDAVNVMKNGAFDFLSKPLDQDRMLVSVRNALKMSLMSQEIKRLKNTSSAGITFSDLIGHKTGLAKTIKIGEKAASNGLPVLIGGGTGTGKEVYAQAIHGQSRRASKPFIAVNCGAIPEKLVESTLFGHEKGSFTGAINKAPGKFQEANGGTLFLDEVGELPLEAQVKLLRALQQKEVEPVGAARPVKVDVRIISATNRDLMKEVLEGRFREDLYFRLNVLQINLPSLCERPEDIEELAYHFMDLFCELHQTKQKALSSQGIEKLRGYHWPGNVRELENTMNRIMALCDEDVIYPDDIQLSHEPIAIPESDVAAEKILKNMITTTNDDGSLKSLKAIEKEIIGHALEKCDYNITKTARMLGIAKSTLYSKMPDEVLGDEAVADDLPEEHSAIG